MHCIPVYLNDLTKDLQQEWISVIQYRPSLWAAYREGKNIIVGYYNLAAKVESQTGENK